MGLVGAGDGDGGWGVSEALGGRGFEGRDAVLKMEW